MENANKLVDVTHFKSEKTMKNKILVYGIIFIFFLLHVIELLSLSLIYDELQGFVFKF